MFNDKEEREEEVGGAMVRLCHEPRITIYQIVYT